MLSGVATCSESSGLTTVSWRVDNNSATPIRGTDLGLVFGVSGVEVAAGGSRSGSETMVGPARATRIDNEFYGSTEVDGETLPFYAYAVVDVAACVASGPTTTAGATSSSVPPSTTPAPEALVLTGEVVCGASGDSTVTWTMHNNTGTAIRGTDLRLVFGVSGMDIPAQGAINADETITGPGEAGTVYNEVYGFSGSGSSTQPFYASATLELGACTPAAATAAVVAPTTTSSGAVTSVAPSTTGPLAPTGVAITGNAVCDPAAAQTQVIWTVTNSSTSAVGIIGDTRGLTFSADPIPPGAASTATEVIDSPAAVEQIVETVTVDTGEPAESDISATVTVADCTGPAQPASISFAFTVDASVESTSVGDTIEYSYCGENTSDLDLEVVRVVDDRFGVLDLPDEPATVLPGDTICTGDVGPPIAYVVTAGDAGKTITNNAVATVRILGDEPQGFQAVDAAEVQVLAAASTTTIAGDDAAAIQAADRGGGPGG